MIGQRFAHGDSSIHRLDPRPRIVAALAFSIVVAVATRLDVVLAALAVGLALTVLARLRPLDLLKRLIEVNVFVLMLWLVLPFTTPGSAIWRVGPFTATRQGVQFALLITLKCNAIALALTALVATVDVVALGHALAHLHVPPKLIHIFLFMVRYFDVLHREYHRLTTALKVRCFRPRTNRHSYRTAAYLVGTLLVRSFDRAERVLAAMKCRGFRNRFYALSDARLGRRDVVFAAVSLAVIGTLGWMQWLWMAP